MTRGQDVARARASRRFRFGWLLLGTALAALLRPRAGTTYTPQVFVNANRGSRAPERWLCAKGTPAKVCLRAVGPEGAEMWNHAQDALNAGGFHGVYGVAGALQHLADSVAAGAGQVAHHLWPPAWADDAAATATAATAAASTEPVLDPNTKYLFGPDGNVLIDPMNNKPIPDDWWNGFIGFQANLMKEMDSQLRAAGVTQAFGWTIVLYTLLVKVLFYPLQQSQLRSTSMMQLLSPKVKEIQERYKDDPETMQRLLMQLYSVMDVSPLGGCLPVLLTLPIYWSLYGVWRRLAAEQFPHYTEGWLWVPSLAQPNPDFQFKFDWLLDFTNGAPTMGWDNYLSYLIFPAFLIGFTIVQTLQSQATKPKTEGKQEDQNVLLTLLPWISVYFIGSLSLELPQAVSVYYTINTVLTLAQTAFVKWNLRKEIVGYEEFEKTGKFPETAFEDMVRQSTPLPKTLHEAALKGDIPSTEAMLDGKPLKGQDAPVESVDINSWDEKQITPLGYATACGHREMVKILLSRGADITRLDGQDNTVLHYASGYGHLEVLQDLLEESKGKWPNNEWTEMLNRKGQTVLDAARVNRKQQVLKFLYSYLGIEEPAPQVEVIAAPDSDITARAKAALLAAVDAEQAKQAAAPAPPAPAAEPVVAAARAAAPARAVD